MTYEQERRGRPAATERERIGDEPTRANENAASRMQQMSAQVSGRIDDATQRTDDARARVQQMGAELAGRIDATTTTAGARVSDAAETLRRSAPATGVAADLATTAADRLQQAGDYMQQHDLTGQIGLADLVDRYPLQSFFIAVGAGYLLARSMDTRY